MFRKVLLLAIRSTLFFGCAKNKKPENKSTESQQKAVDTDFYFKFKVEVKVKKDDTFRLLYTKNIEDKFDGKVAVTKKIKGSIDFQIIEFKVPPKNLYPSKIRLNLGNNRNQNDVAFKSIEIFHNTSTLHIPAEKFSYYLTPNKFVKQKNTTREYVLNDKNGSYAPFLLSSKNLNQDLQSIKNKANVYPYFIVKLKTKITKNDKLRLLYTEEIGLNFEEKKSVTRQVIGTKDYQEIDFNKNTCEVSLKTIDGKQLPFFNSTKKLHKLLVEEF